MFNALPALTLALLPLAYVEARGFVTTKLALRALSSSGSAQVNDTAAVLQALMSAKIIPNVIPNFTPAFPLDVVFTDDAGSKFPVSPGANLTESQTANTPLFALRSNNTQIIGKPYLMAIVDPDALTPQNPNVSEFRHFLAADYISNGSTNGDFILTNQSKTATLTDYTPPSPPPTSPAHRYVVLCYLQNSIGVTPPASFNATNRLNFNITSFVNSVQGNNFRLLAATFFFVSPNDTVGSVAANSTTGNPLASATAPATPSASSKPNGAIKHSIAVAWSVVAILSATGALLL